MSSDTFHRTTVDVELEAFNQARDLLGTSGFKDTINAALRQVERAERLRAGAAAILADKHALATPDDLETLRRPRN